MPGGSRVYFKDGIANAHDFTSYDTDCYVQLKDVSVYDRAIEPTMEPLRVVKNQWGYNEYRGWVVLVVDSPVISAFVCESRSSVDAVVIKQFRHHFGSYVSLELKSPEPVYP